jgi:hypothetical protein
MFHMRKRKKTLVNTWRTFGTRRRSAPGDFNDTYGEGCRSLKMWGHAISLRNEGMKTCCTDEQLPNSDYPFHGDYVYSSDSMSGEGTLVRDRELKTSDHRAVLYKRYL